MFRLDTEFLSALCRSSVNIKRYHIEIQLFSSEHKNGLAVLSVLLWGFNFVGFLLYTHSRAIIIATTPTFFVFFFFFLRFYEGWDPSRFTRLPPVQYNIRVLGITVGCECGVLCVLCVADTQYTWFRSRCRVVFFGFFFFPPFFITVDVNDILGSSPPPPPHPFSIRIPILSYTMNHKVITLRRVLL